MLASDLHRADLARVVRARQLPLATIYEDASPSGRVSEVISGLLVDAHAGKFTILVLHSISDLGTNPHNALSNAGKLAAVGVMLISLEEPWAEAEIASIAKVGAWLDRQQVLRRQAEGRESVRKAKALGRCGRPRKTFEIERARALVARLPLAQAARALGCSPSLLRARLKNAESSPSAPSTPAGACISDALQRACEEAPQTT